MRNPLSSSFSSSAWIVAARVVLQCNPAGIITLAQLATWMVGTSVDYIVCIIQCLVLVE